MSDSGNNESWGELRHVLAERLPIYPIYTKDADQRRRVRDWVRRYGEPGWFLSDYDDKRLRRPLRYLISREILMHGEELGVFADAPRFYQEKQSGDEGLLSAQCLGGSFIGLERSYQAEHVCLAHVPLDVAQRTLHKLYFEQLSLLPEGNERQDDIDRLREASRPTGELGEVESPRELFEAASVVLGDIFLDHFRSFAPGMYLAVQTFQGSSNHSAQHARQWAITLPMWVGALADLNLPNSPLYDWYYQINVALWDAWELSESAWPTNFGRPVGIG